MSEFGSILRNRRVKGSSLTPDIPKDVINDIGGGGGATYVRCVDFFHIDDTINRSPNDTCIPIKRGSVSDCKKIGGSSLIAKNQGPLINCKKSTYSSKAKYSKRSALALSIARGLAIFFPATLFPVLRVAVSKTA